MHSLEASKRLLLSQSSNRLSWLYGTFGLINDQTVTNHIMQSMMVPKQSILDSEARGVGVGVGWGKRGGNLGAGHAPLGGAVHEGREGQAA